MPRSMSEKYDEAFRIVVKSGALQSVKYYGPYATPAAARGQITGLRQANSRNYWSEEPTPPFEAWIEKSSAKWQRVD